MSGVPLLILLLKAREGSHLVTLLPFLTTGTVGLIAEDSAGVSADMQTGARRGRFSGASAVIPDRR